MRLTISHTKKGSRKGAKAQRKKGQKKKENIWVFWGEYFHAEAHCVGFEKIGLSFFASLRLCVRY